MTTATIIPYRKPQNDAWDRLVEGLDSNARIELLQRLLGDPACRQLGLYPIPDGFKLSVVIPVYNEERWVAEVVRRVRAVDIPKEVILVDDCSTDGTREVLRRLEGDGVRVYYQ